MIMEQVAQSKFQVNWAVLGVQHPKSSLTTECPGLGTTGKSLLLLHNSQGGESRRIPGLTSDTRCRFLLAMTVRQPCLQGRDG